MSQQLAVNQQLTNTKDVLDQRVTRTHGSWNHVTTFVRFSEPLGWGRMIRVTVPRNELIKVNEGG